MSNGQNCYPTKYLKFGYGRVTDQVSIEIRNQSMTRDEGIEFIEKYEHKLRPTNLDVFLKFAEISEQQFLDYIDHLRDDQIWEKKSNNSYELLDWVGNHKNDEFVNDAVDAITTVAKKDGDKGRGKIFIIPIEECIRIRSGEKGSDAIG